MGDVVMDVLALLQRIDARLERLERIDERLAALPEQIVAAMQQKGAGAPRRLSHADEAALADLLPAIMAVVSSRPFTVHQLTKLAERDVAPAIVLREKLASISSRKLGKLLGRCRNCGLEGFTVTAAEGPRDGLEWRIFRGDDEPHKVATRALMREVRF